MKKTYIAIIGNDGKTIGTVIIRGFVFHSAKWYYDQVSDSLSGGVIIDFKRIK